jgi:hypothetical protein
MHRKRATDKEWYWGCVPALAEIEKAALGDNIGFFLRNKFSRSHSFANIIYVAAALAGGERVVNWASQQQIEDVATEWGGLQLESCLSSLVRAAWRKIWPTAMKKLMEKPEVRKYAVYRAVLLGAQTLAKLHSVEKITREKCMQQHGLILQKAGVAAKKYLIRTCGLSRSDFASVGVQFPNECI